MSLARTHGLTVQVHEAAPFGNEPVVARELGLGTNGALVLLSAPRCIRKIGVLKKDSQVAEKGVFGSSAQRELFATEVAHLFGITNVPEVSIISASIEAEAEAQYAFVPWVKGHTLGSRIPPWSDAIESDFFALTAFELLLGNADWHEENLMFGSINSTSARLVALDHALTMGQKVASDDVRNWTDLFNAGEKRFDDVTSRLIESLNVSALRALAVRDGFDRASVMALEARTLALKRGVAANRSVSEICADVWAAMSASASLNETTANAKQSANGAAQRSPYQLQPNHIVEQKLRRFIHSKPSFDIMELTVSLMALKHMLAPVKALFCLWLLMTIGLLFAMTLLSVTFWMRTDSHSFAYSFSFGGQADFLQQACRTWTPSCTFSGMRLVAVPVLTVPHMLPRVSVCFRQPGHTTLTTPGLIINGPGRRRKCFD
eukprot:CAMPEP_0114559824 /NCGR_PEP_ID=MMETSP0114-20121206/11126_1 /TAXON_ID=31324 /ORGANISM="Goniomonas sp, Strain m" /LENGTH=432 /DNA_ID=CAMNT_0001745317 /DNA_START=51 /DNA_END=1349 /DNA_ORIENTATION=+